jgi:hypothetical protein
MIDPKLNQNPSVSPNATNTIPMNLELEPRYGIPTYKNGVFNVLTFGFVVWGLFYLLDLIKAVEFFYFLIKISPDTGSVLIYTIKQAPVLSLTPVIFSAMLLAHIFISIFYGRVTKNSKLPAVAFMIFSTFILVGFNMLLFSETARIAKNVKGNQILLIPGGEITPTPTEEAET